MSASRNSSTARTSQLADGSRPNIVGAASQPRSTWSRAIWTMASRDAAWFSVLCASIAAAGSSNPSRRATSTRSAWIFESSACPRSCTSCAPSGSVVHDRICAAYMRSPPGSAPRPIDSVADGRCSFSASRYRWWAGRTSLDEHGGNRSRGLRVGGDGGERGRLVQGRGQQALDLADGAVHHHGGRGLPGRRRVPQDRLEGGEERRHRAQPREVALESLWRVGALERRDLAHELGRPPQVRSHLQSVDAGLDARELSGRDGLQHVEGRALGLGERVAVHGLCILEGGPVHRGAGGQALLAGVREPIVEALVADRGPEEGLELEHGVPEAVGQRSRFGVGGSWCRRHGQRVSLSGAGKRDPSRPFCQREG